MRKQKRIILLFIGLFVILTLRVYASSTQIQITGNSEVKIGSTETMTIKITTDGQAIGVVSGKIQISDNISNMQIKGKNSWQVTYNQSTGEFNALKAEGAKTEEFADITYTVESDTTDKVTLTISNINVTTIDYETINASNISKEVIVSSNEIQEPEDSPIQSGEDESTQTPSTNQTSNAINKQEGTSNNTNTDNKTLSSTLPKAGLINYLFIIIVGVIIISIVLYKKYRKYNGIN